MSRLVKRLSHPLRAAFRATPHHWWGGIFHTFQVVGSWKKNQWELNFCRSRWPKSNSRYSTSFSRRSFLPTRYQLHQGSSKFSTSKLQWITAHRSSSLRFIKSGISWNRLPSRSYSEKYSPPPSPISSTHLSLWEIKAPATEGPPYFK